MSGARAGRLRTAVQVLFVIGSLGLVAELLLLAHTDGALQLIPLALLGAGLAAAGWVALSGSRVSLLGLRWTGVLQILSGLTGLVLHYLSNVEFELEMQPDAGGAGLVWAALTGAIPALAPGAMVQLGLLGVLGTYAHPLLSRSTVPPPSSES